MKNSKGFKNLHLAVSALLIFVIAVIYGFMPEKIVPALIDFKTDSNDIKNAFKAIMGLYLGISIFWTAGIIRPNLWQGATLSNILLMLGLGIGRILSIVIDGIPSDEMIGGTVLELILGIWGIISIRKYSSISN
jgi:hypothetical protein